MTTCRRAAEAPAPRPDAATAGANARAPVEISVGNGHSCARGPDGTPPLAIEEAAGATGFAVAAPDARRICVARGAGAPVCFDAQLWDPLAAGTGLAVRNLASIEELAGASALMILGRDGGDIC